MSRTIASPSLDWTLEETLARLRGQERVEGLLAIGSLARDEMDEAQRLIQVDDPLYRATTSVRMALYGHMDVWFGYWDVRGLPFAGDKAAVRYLQAHDPAFLETYRRFIAETTPEDKLALYEQAAAPLGGVWAAGQTAMNVAGALETWQTLLEVENDPAVLADPPGIG